MRRSLVLAMAVAGISLFGCDTGDLDAPVPSADATETAIPPNRGIELVLYEGSPVAPPSVTIGGVNAELISYEWVTENGTALETSYPESAAVLDTVVSLDTVSDSYTMMLDTPFAPTRVELLSYAGRSEKALEQGVETIVCEGVCGEKEDGVVHVALEVSSDARLLVVLLFFAPPIAEGADAPIHPYNYASYAIGVE